MITAFQSKLKSADIFKTYSRLRKSSTPLCKRKRSFHKTSIKYLKMEHLCTSLSDHLPCFKVPQDSIHILKDPGHFFDQLKVCHLLVIFNFDFIDLSFISRKGPWMLRTTYAYHLSILVPNQSLLNWYAISFNIWIPLILTFRLRSKQFRKPLKPTTSSK